MPDLPGVIEFGRLGVEVALLLVVVSIKTDLRHVWKNIDALWAHHNPEKSK